MGGLWLCGATRPAGSGTDRRVHGRLRSREGYELETGSSLLAYTFLLMGIGLGLMAAALVRE